MTLIVVTYFQSSMFYSSVGADSRPLRGGGGLQYRGTGDDHARRPGTTQSCHPSCIQLPGTGRSC